MLRLSILILLALPGPVCADAAPLFSGAPRADTAPLFSGAARPLFARAESTTTVSTGSLFAGTQSGSLFAPLPPRIDTSPRRDQGVTDTIAHLLSLIGRAEAGRAGYDAVQHGARIRTPRPPTQMTLGEIFDWIEQTPGQPHAIGRYQFIPSTLRRVVGIRGFGPDIRFTPEVQDALALVLLEDADLNAFEIGELPRRSFMHNLARIWAGLPLPNGQSYYEGYAGNRASMTWAEFDGGMERIWPRG